MRLRSPDFPIRCLLGVFLFIAMLCTGEAAPRRIVSLCLQGDQLLMQLADPAEVAAISWLGSDPDLSPHWEAGRSFPATRGSAEELIQLRPDLVLTGLFSTPATNAVLEKLNVRVVKLGAPQRFQELSAMIREVATALGGSAPKKGEAIIAAMEARRERLIEEGRLLRERLGRKPKALFYFQDGYTPGAATFANELLETIGFENMGETLARKNAVSTPLEAVVLAQPDLLIMAAYQADSPTSREISSSHPVLRNHRNVIAFPFRHLDCPDPTNLEAIEEVLSFFVKQHR